MFVYGNIEPYIIHFINVIRDGMKACMAIAYVNQF